VEDLFSRASIKDEGKVKIKGNYSTAIELLAITLVMSIICQLMHEDGQKYYWIIFVVNILVSALVQMAEARFYMDITKGNSNNRTDNYIKFGSTHFVKALLLYLLTKLIVAIGLILLIVPGIIWSIKYRFVMYVLADDPEMSVTEALERSGQLTNGHKMDLFIFELSFIPWVLLAIVTFGIASLYAAPYSKSSTAVYYNRLKNEYDKSNNYWEDTNENSERQQN
jgi:uncharacterized membrane protein